MQAAVKNMETYLKENEAKPLPAKANTPLSTDYRPELDITPYPAPKEASHFMSMIGVLRWIVELGESICIMMSPHLALPRVGHLEQV